MDFLERRAPASTAMAWDNVGLLVGRADMAVTKILTALDATDDVAAEAIAIGANAIITHHPVIFKDISRVTDETNLGRRLLTLIQHDIAVFSAHTNLDAADGGTNDVLAEHLGLSDASPLIYDEGALPIGRQGRLATPVSLGDLALRVKTALGLDAVRICGAADKPVQTVAICAGSGAKHAYISQVTRANCDVYITADITFHEAQDALAGGLPLIDATHYASEAPIVPHLQMMLSEAFAARGVQVVASHVNGQVFQTM